MEFEFGSEWLQEHKKLIHVLQQIIRESGRFKDFYKNVAKGSILFNEGESLSSVFILLEGQVQLYKKREEEQKEFPVDILSSGSFIGIIAYATGNRSLTTGKAITDVSLLEIPHSDFETYFNEQPEIRDHLNKLLLANLVERYQHTISLKLRLEAVNSELKKERNDLEKAYYDLKVAQSKLVHQEKMATLGQLVAGFAHEINNPASALIRSVDVIHELYEEMFTYLAEHPGKLSKFVSLTQAGMESTVMSSSEVRERMSRISKNYPSLARSLVRKLAQIPEESFRQVIAESGAESNKIKSLTVFFEYGKKIKNAKSAGTRIVNLVKSLKNYSRQDNSEKEWIDITEGIQDTLQLVRNRLKYYELHLELNDVPEIYGSAGELNQVWTNIILNACDAMGKKGRLTIRCYTVDSNILVEFLDSGSGIDYQLMGQIFEPNVTTKRHDTKFGLGLGLYISKNIIEQHNGTIKAENREEGGAKIEVVLPVPDRK